MSKYRSHNCEELRLEHAGVTVTLSGWVFRMRDHGGVLFVDLRDGYGVTQLVWHLDSPSISVASELTLETVITITGEVRKRSAEMVNSSISTGMIEVFVSSMNIESISDQLPFSMSSALYDCPEDLRLRYRFLDLRRKELRDKILLRSEVISEIRDRMHEMGFVEFQTPLLTSSTPEGARDYLVPSRLHPGKFYALPQAPQQFKQLLMVSGFDKYFQIAPCFRDEDARADRSPGSFYQLDLEMAFADQEDVFAVVEKLLIPVFKKFSVEGFHVDDKIVRIPYAEAMAKYATDKPDLRNPIEISDVTEVFRNSEFETFSKRIATNNMVVKAIRTPKTQNCNRSFFDSQIAYAVEKLGARGLGYISFDKSGAPKGPIAKFLSSQEMSSLQNITKASPGDTVFFTCDKEKSTISISCGMRNHLGTALDLIDQHSFKFCWVTDFPFFEYNHAEMCLDFSHNPFSMPQGGLEALKNQNPIDITAYQYDLVCNGIEISSGAVRNHKLDILYEAFRIAGYSRDAVDEKFSAMVNAFKFGAPPHAGAAPGIERILMLLSNSKNIREVICFPLNQKGEDPLLNAPSKVSSDKLKELKILLSPMIQHDESSSNIT